MENVWGSVSANSARYTLKLEFSFIGLMAAKWGALRSISLMVEKWGACLGSNEYGEQDEQPGMNSELFKSSLIELSTLSNLLADFLHDHWYLKNEENDKAC